MPSMNKSINWGILGLGNIAHQFVKDALLVREANVVAAASRSLDKAAAFCEQYQIPKAYGNYADLITDESIDILYIATPHHNHALWTMAAMNAGKHVLCEKPLAVNQQQVDYMIKSAKSNKVFLMEAFWSRFNPSIQSCLAKIQAGEIGSVNYVNADFSFFRDDPPDSRMLNMDLAGGSLLDMGVYPIFLAYVLFGRPKEVLAAAHFHDTGADLQTAVILKFDQGLANLYSGFRSQSDMVAKIYGTTGRIYIQPNWHETQGYTLIKGNDGECKEENFEYPTKGKGFTYEIEACHQCLWAGKLESELWSHQNSRDLIMITDEIRKQIDLKYPFEGDT